MFEYSNPPNSLTNLQHAKGFIQFYEAKNCTIHVLTPDEIAIIHVNCHCFPREDMQVFHNGGVELDDILL